MQHGPADPLPDFTPVGALTGRTILQIIPELEAGGAERTTIDIAAALADMGARALVASEGGRLVAELQARGGTWLPFPAKTKNPFAMALNIPRLARLIRNERVELIHARSRAPAWVALGAARMAKIPFLTTWHGNYTGRSALKMQYNSVMVRGQVVIANSAYTGRLISKLYPNMPAKLCIIDRGTDLKAFSPANVSAARVQALREAWGVGMGGRVILLAGRLTGWKGQKVLIEAASLLKQAENFEDVRYVLAGDDQGRHGYVRELDALIRQKGLEGIVRRVGHCADMPAAFLASALVTVPSTEPEAFGRIAVEAQAMGVPVIVSNLGAVPETVLAPPEVGEAERTGWHFPSGDAKALADTIVAALSMGASARTAIAARARRHVEAHFSVARMASRTLDVYAGLLK